MREHNKKIYDQTSVNEEEEFVDNSGEQQEWSNRTNEHGRRYVMLVRQRKVSDASNF